MCDNQAYEVPGNYILLNNLINNDSKIQRLILIINPFSLSSNLNQKYTYNYFIKPFDNFLWVLDKKEREYINNVFPSKKLMHIPYYKYSFSRFELENSIDIQNIKKIVPSELNLKYINKIDSLCKSNGIDFKLISPPLVRSKRKNIELVKKDVFYSSYKNIIKTYFENIYYYDDSLSSDGWHFDDIDNFFTKHNQLINEIIK